MDEPRPSRTLWLVRYGVPAALVIAGFAILAIDRSTAGAEGWAMLTGAAGAIALLNVLFRIGVRGDVERADEATARDYLDEHGDWPEEVDDEPRGRKWVLAKGVVTPEMEAAEAAGAGRGDGPGGAAGDSKRRGERPGDGAGDSEAEGRG